MASICLGLNVLKGSQMCVYTAQVEIKGYLGLGK